MPEILFGATYQIPKDYTGIAKVIYRAKYPVQYNIYYLNNGIKHRIDGPASYFITNDGKITGKQYWINGEKITKKQFYLLQDLIKLKQSF